MKAQCHLLERFKELRRGWSRRFPVSILLGKNRRVNGGDGVLDFSGQSVFPKSKNSPTLPAQLSRHLLVAVAIPLNFRPPEFGPQKVFPSRILPAVPKITVEEDANPRFSENDVGLAEDGWVIKPEGLFAPRFQNFDESGFHF
jgi:hypothetical protein